MSESPPMWYRQISAGQWKGFWASWMGYLLDGFDFVLITLVLTQVMRDFHLDLAEGATLVSAAFVSRWFGGLALGALSDIYGRKLGMIASITLYSVGSLGCALSIGYWSMFASRLIIGLGMAGEYSASSLFVIEAWPKSLRNKASGFLISGFSIGVVVAGQAYRFVVPHYGWRAMFFIGMIPILITFWLRRGLHETPRAEPSASRPTGRRDIFHSLYGGRLKGANLALTVLAFAALLLVFTDIVNSTVLVAGAGTFVAVVFVFYVVQFAGSRSYAAVFVLLTVFAAFLYSWPIQALLPTYLKLQLGYDAGQVSDIIFFSGFGAAAGCILAGFTGDYFGTRRAYWMSLLVSQVLIFPVFLIGGRSLWILGVLLFLQQMFGQGIAGLLPKWIGGYFRTSERASALGFIYNVGALGGALAPVLGATVSRAMPLGRALAIISFVLTFVVIILVGLNAPGRMQRWFGARSSWPTDFSESFPVD